MTFSIVVPVWNQQEYLPDALDSILDQTFTDYEIIVVIDGSPDNSLQIAQKYAQEHGSLKIKVIHQKNKGLASARNTGIMNAKGIYCLPLDADDQLLPNCLEKMAEAISQTNADIIAPSFKHFGVLNEPLILGGTLTLEDFKTANRLPYFCAIKREALLECGGYSPRMTWGWEDFHMWFTLFSRGKIVCVLQDILVLYRTKEHSMIDDANEHSEELWAQIKKDFPELWK